MCIASTKTWTDEEEEDFPLLEKKPVKLSGVALVTE